MQRKRVVYFHHDEISIFEHGSGHQRKPFRAKLAHSLIKSLGIYEAFLEPLRPRLVTMTDLGQFHADNYISMLRFTQENIDSMECAPSRMLIESTEVKENDAMEQDNGSSSVETVEGSMSKSLQRFNLGLDKAAANKVFPGLLDYCRMYTTGTVGCAGRIISGEADVAINWYGGMSHARSAAAYGGCYINDIVLSILMLLRKFPRVLFINFDAQHCDAVEEAFYTTNKVFTVSFHSRPKEGSFPGTGNIDDIGSGKGHGYALNVPLDSDVNDASLASIFKSVVGKVKSIYEPEVVVFQSGGNLLAGDRFSDFNLVTMNAHINCLQVVRAFNLPIIMLGGGGMNMANTAKLWAYETAVLADAPMNGLTSELPADTEYREYFAPEYKVVSSPTKELQVEESTDIKNVRRKILANLNKLSSQSLQTAQYD